MSSSKHALNGSTLQLIMHLVLEFFEKAERLFKYSSPLFLHPLPKIIPTFKTPRKASGLRKQDVSVNPFEYPLW